MSHIREELKKKDQLFADKALYMRPQREIVINFTICILLHLEMLQNKNGT